MAVAEPEVRAATVGPKVIQPATGKPGTKRQGLFVVNAATFSLEPMTAAYVRCSLGLRDVGPRRQVHGWCDQVIPAVNN